MSSNNRFSFIGGDDRSYYMVELLYAQGFQTAVYGLQMLKPLDGVVIASTMKEALAFSNIIVCPVPFSRDKINIFSTCTKEDMNIDSFVHSLRRDQKLFAGDINAQVVESLNYHNIPFYDFMQTEAVSIKNAVATAEGTIAEAIKISPVNLHNHACLVLGYGRCAKILADKLKGLSMQVTIGARNADQLAMAESYGYQTVTLDEFPNKVMKYDFIFNSIPVMILDEAVLRKVKKDVLIIDIASNPGGTDFEKCKELGIQAYLCLGLPGKYAPLSSAEILNSVLMQNL